MHLFRLSLVSLFTMGKMVSQTKSQQNDVLRLSLKTRIWFWWILMDWKQRKWLWWILDMDRIFADISHIFYQKIFCEKFSFFSNLSNSWSSHSQRMLLHYHYGQISQKCRCHFCHSLCHTHRDRAFLKQFFPLTFVCGRVRISVKFGRSFRMKMKKEQIWIFR